MKSIANSPSWKHIDTNVDLSFQDKVRNLPFGMILDDMNPFALNSTSHSTWPIMLLIYNLPFYLVTKKFFIQLSILLSTKMLPQNQDIGVFIRLIIEELQRIWVEVST